MVRVIGSDTQMVGGAHVTLHRVTPTNPGAVDSMLSDAGGRFGFRIAADSGVVYLVSARWAGIEYFAAPFVVHVDSPPPTVTVVVSDTSSTTPFRLVARHLIVSPPSPEGSRDVVELFVLENAGTVTRVSAAPGKPTWRAHLPRFAVNVRPGNSDFAADAVKFAGDLVALFAAIPPGQRDVELDYQIPPNSAQFELPVDEDVPISNVVSADKGMRIAGFTRSDTVIDNKPYARWQGSLTAGKPLVLEFGNADSTKWLVPLLAGAMALVLVGVTVRAVRRAA
ncbi:MAG: hypothetical protein ABUL71_01695 [Gemmatimonadota bacterium]